VLRAIHSSIGHFLLGFFGLKAASYPNVGYLCVTDVCNPGACNQRSISILGQYFFKHLPFIAAVNSSPSKVFNM
jgi:hypothetical protein